MSHSKAAYNVIVGGILLHLTLGTLYCFGNIQPYVTSYLRLHHPSVTNRDTSIIYSCATLGHSLIMPTVGLLQFTLGLRVCAAFGAGLLVLSTFGCSLATSVSALAILNAIFGCGIAFAYTCPLVSGYAWMPDRKGTVSGFIVAGFGAGAAVFNGVATAWVNPHDTSPNPATGYYDQAIAERVPGMYVLLGSCYLVLGFCGILMLAPPPPAREEGIPMVDAPHFHSTANNRKQTIHDFTGLEPGSWIGADGETCTPPLPSLPMGKEEQDTDNTNKQLKDEEHQATPLLAAAPTVSESVLWKTLGSTRMRDAEGQMLNDDIMVVIAGGRQECDEARASRSLSPLGAAEDAVDTEGLERTACHQSKLDRAMNEEPQRQYQLKELLVEPDFYHVALSFLLTSVSGLFIVGNYKGIARDRFPNDDLFLSILGSCASLFNASGRIVGGLAVDRFGSFATLLAMSVLMGCVLLLSTLAPLSSRIMLFMDICVLFFLYGSNFAIYPTLSAELFGATVAGPNYGLVFMMYGVGSFVIMIFLAEMEGNENFFLVCMTLSFAGAVSVSFLWERTRRKRCGHVNAS